MTYKLTLPILESGYGLSEPASGVAVATKGGFSRTRADLDDASLSVTVSWKLTEATYNALLAFYQFNGQNWFLIDLITDNAVPTECTAKFSGGPQLTQVAGLNYWVSATLEVRPNPINTAFDCSIVAVYAASNSNAAQYLDAFNQLVNVRWPHL